MSISAIGCKTRARWTTRAASCRRSVSPPTAGAASRPEPSAENGVHQELEVQDHNDPGDNPCQDGKGTRNREAAHLSAVRHELHQWDHRKRQLHRQDHLAEDQKLSGTALAIE